MPITLQGQTGPQSLANNGSAPVRLGKQGEVVTNWVNGPHFDHTLNGNAFVYHVASQALLLSATTGGHPTVFNPAGSGVIFVPTALRISFISGTTVIGAVILAETLNAGSQAATGSAILTATAVAAKPALRGGNAASKVIWSPTTNTFTAAPTAICATGINLGAAAPTGTGTYECKFDGSIAFYPGTACSVCYTVTTSTALFQITLFGLEVPLPPGS